LFFFIFYTLGLFYNLFFFSEIYYILSSKKYFFLDEFGYKTVKDLGDKCGLPGKWLPFDEINYFDRWIDYLILFSSSGIYLWSWDLS
jgi:hypothetical protein